MSRLLHDSPVGPLLLTADGDALTGCWFGGDGPRSTDDPVLLETAAQLDAYFAGERDTFDLTLAASGSDFQRTVWAALREIPYGTTTTYGELAARLGRPDASRAVGLANGRNPISVIVPCHRVIGAKGALTGYGGGLDRKRWLLRHEGALLL